MTNLALLSERIMKHQEQPGFFDDINRMDKLRQLGDPLESLSKLINWEQFRPVLAQAFAKEAKGPGGRPAYDCVLMFRVLILQRFYNVSDDQIEYQIVDRVSFRSFLGLGPGHRVPDSKTVWLFREALTRSGVVEKLFATFNASLDAAGLVANEGKIVDASFVLAPRQRNTKEENALVKEGVTPEEWKGNPHKLAQKDLDARWTKKGEETHYGYKNHVKADAKSKLIDTYTVTPANVHDSQELANLLNTQKDRDQPLWADSAYRSWEIELTLLAAEMDSKVHEKGYRNSPLTSEQKASNTTKSRVRARVEHIFGFIESSMNESYLCCIGIVRTTSLIGLMNLTYNMFRSIQLQRIDGTSLSI